MKQLEYTTTIVLFIVVLTMLSSSGRAQVTEEWVRTYNPAARCVSNATALDQAGNIYTAGSLYDGTRTTMLLLKYDAAGNLLWSRTPSSGRTAYAAVVDGNGDIIITGSASAYNDSGITVKYDQNGSMLWSQITTMVHPGKLVVDEQNNVYLTGNGTNPLYLEQIITIKYNNAGIQQWTASYAGRTGNSCYRGGFLYVTGYVFVHLPKTPPGVSTPVILTLKYDAATGSQIWASLYYHSDKLAQNGHDVTADGNGNVYVTGRVWTKSGNQQNIDWITLKYNSAGARQWATRYDGSGNDSYSGQSANTGDYPYAITLDGNGDPVVTGTSYSTYSIGQTQYTGRDITTVKYSPTGTQLWAVTYDGPTHMDDEAFTIVALPSGNIYVAGMVGANDPAGTTNAVSIKYNGSGVLQWTATYDGGSTVTDKANAVKLDNTGNVYASGYSGNSALLAKYSQTGTPKVPNENQQSSPKACILSQNYPNPFNPSTTIPYTLAESGPVVLKVYNALGMEVAKLVDGIQNAGVHQAPFLATGLESGVYTYELTVAGRIQSRKMVLVK